MDKDIRVRTFKFGLRVINIYQQIPRTGAGYILGKQLLRAGTSVGANVEEATAASSKADFTNKMNIALKEARETQYWLRLLCESKIVDDLQFHELLDESNQIGNILGSIVSKMRVKRTA